MNNSSLSFSPFRGCFTVEGGSSAQALQARWCGPESASTGASTQRGMRALSDVPVSTAMSVSPGLLRVCEKEVDHPECLFPVICKGGGWNLLSPIVYSIKYFDLQFRKVSPHIN